MTEYLTPADELRAAAEKVSAMTETMVTALGVNVANQLSDWLVAVADELDDEGAHVVEHPEWIGLAEDLRWGVHANYGQAKADREPWKTALIAARAFNAEVAA